MIGAADYRLVFRRKAGNDERQNVSYGSLADVRERIMDVRFIPSSRHAHRRHQCLLSAISGHFAACSVGQ
jgi:hypothetical protein